MFAMSRMSNEVSHVRARAPLVVFLRLLFRLVAEDTPGLPELNIRIGTKRDRISRACYTHHPSSPYQFDVPVQSC